MKKGNLLNRKYIGMILNILMLSSIAAAVPSNPMPFELIQTDGSVINAVQVGDETGAHFETVDGFTIIKSGEMWVYAAKDNQGKLVSSGYKVGYTDPVSIGLDMHLHTTASLIENVGITGSEKLDPLLSRKISSYVSELAAQIGTKKVLVILVNFTDLNAAISSTPTYYQNLIFNSTAGANSMNNYFKEVSFNQMDVAGVVAGNRWFRMSNNLAWYGADITDIDLDLTQPNPNDRYIFKLAKDAVIAADPYVDYSQYDTNGDGVIDHILVVHAGNGQESSNVDTDIWSHSWDIYNWNGSAWNFGIMTNDGVKAIGYTMLAEKSPVGTFAHEFGHDIGLPDHYNTSSGNGVVGPWDIMDGGSWNNNGNTPSHPSAWDKIKLGWMNSTRVTLNSTKNVLQLETNGQAYRVNNSTMAANEYFLIENRQMTGYDSALPEAGILIWHVDENRLNNNGVIKMLIPQDASNGAVTGLRGAAYSLNDGQTAFTPSTSPNSKSNTGVNTGISIFDIGSEGQSMPITINLPGGGTPDPLNATVSESPDPVGSGNTSIVTVTVTSSGISIGGANVTVSATGGALNPISGTTDANGRFISTFTAPVVNITRNYTINATASKTGYTSASGSDLITVNPPACNQPWDVNMDGIVNVQDLVIVGQHFGETTTSPYPVYDINQDGIVNVQDLVIVGQRFGQLTCYT